MSRRRGRPPAGDAPAASAAPARTTDEGPAGAAARRAARPPFGSHLLAQAAILLAVFAVVSLVAELAGAANLGVALGIGSIAFSIALVFVIVRD